MPQIDWTPEFKRTTTLEFDKLKLKVGERARIVTLEKPTFTWVHTLRAPKIVDGHASKVIKKRKDGTEYADWDMDFIGRPQCLGDHATIAEDGLDAANCAVCARAKESEECSAPERRFAMNIIKYNTKADGSLVTPFGCASQVWVFTEGIYNKLYDIAQEYGGLVGRDLILGPCQVPEAFQKFEISAGAKNIWEADDNVSRLVRDTHQGNRVDALEAACGRRAELRWLKEDVKKVAQRWAVAHGNAAPDEVSSQQQDVNTLKGELDNLLAPAPVRQVVAQPDQTVAEAAASGQLADATPMGSEPNPDPVTTNTVEGDAAPDDFSKLLAGLKI